MAPIRFLSILRSALLSFLVWLLPEMAKQIAVDLVKDCLVPVIHHLITMILISWR
jgi:hypothetical protein